MVDVHVSFFSKGFALSDEDEARAYVKQLAGLAGWKSGYFKDRYCYRTIFIYDAQYESKEEYEENHKTLNNELVHGLKLLGYKDDELENLEKIVNISVISYNIPGLYKDWHEQRIAKKNQ